MPDWLKRRRTWLAVAAALLPAAGLWAWRHSAEPPPIKVGVLHSLTGTMAISERSVADATLLAIDEINAQGGLLGRRVEPVVVDGQSDWSTFARQAERLIVQERVSVVFGCWTSACRKTVKPVFEQRNHLLVYPVQYEGLEQSPNIVYTGAAPNQQIIPAIKWAFDHLGKRMFLVGSDYIFPHTANAIIADQLKALGGTLAGERYLALGDTRVEAIVHAIKAAHPDVIVNTINGDTNLAFFKALRAAGVSARQIPTLSFSLAEEELRHLQLADVAGDYAAWNYFQSIDDPVNRAFVRRYKQKYGAARVTDDPIEAGYIGALLWAQAVQAADSAEPSRVRLELGQQSLHAPEGIVSIDAATQHSWKTVRIGRIRPDGQFAIVWTSNRPVRPVPYPSLRSRQQWERFLSGLFQQWGGHWAKPGGQP